MIRQVTDEVVDAFDRLLPQLSRSAPPLGRDGIESIVACPANTLLVSRSPAGSITGTLTLVMFPIPTGTRAWIEDVVVDESARGQGAGVALTQEALRLAAGGRGQDGRSDLAALTRGGGPALRAHRLRAPQLTAVPVQPRQRRARGRAGTSSAPA